MIIRTAYGLSINHPSAQAGAQAIIMTTTLATTLAGFVYVSTRNNIALMMQVILRALFLSMLALLLHGCTTSAEKTAGMRQFMLQSRDDLALIEAEKQLADDMTGVMQNMNVGVLRRMNGDFRGSNEAFEQAKRTIDDLYATSVSEQAAALLINDELISFEGDRFEQVLIHMYMASNYLSLHDIDNARVELLQSQVKMEQWDEPVDQVPFMQYFSGILFEILGEDDSATVSYRNAVKTYIRTASGHGLNVPLSLQHDLLRMLTKMQLVNEFNEYSQQFALTNAPPYMAENQGELIVVLGNGLAPQRKQLTLYVWSTELSSNIKIAVPSYRNSPARFLHKALLQVNNRHYPLQMVSNIDGLARAALSEKMPIITARAIARAVVKKKSEKQLGEQNGYAQLALFLLNLSTEIADTRSWNTLPQAFELARVFLPEGEHDVTIEMTGTNGSVIDTMLEKVIIKAGRISVVSKRWTAPAAKHKLVLPVGEDASRKQPAGSSQPIDTL